ncbi:hypothetical protein C9F11_43555 (plasmid) [Streptomyces sp. YIM 121038]|nr:hypothetical protein C9F11_43555 [Streptomyces sp. YIM 121038]
MRDNTKDHTAQDSSLPDADLTQNEPHPSTKGFTYGEMSAHLAEVYGAEVSKSTISTITDAGLTASRVLGSELRPLQTQSAQVECVSPDR